MSTETSRYLHLTTPYVIGHNVIDIGSQGGPVVPRAIQVELPPADYSHYTSGKTLDGPAWRGDGRQLPFKDRMVDTVYSSHLIEDFLDWRPALAEWWRVLRVGGNLIVLTPDNALWERAVANGQCPNCAHRHCGQVGELSRLLLDIDPSARILEDRLTQCHEGDYTILFAAKRTT